MPTHALDNIVYAPEIGPFDGFDAARYNLKIEKEILTRRYFVEKRYQVLKYASLGLSTFLLTPATSEEELQKRIAKYKEFSLNMERQTRIIQRLFAKKIYKAQKEAAARVPYTQKPQFNSYFTTGAELVQTWWKNGSIDLFNGYRGQIIWEKTKSLYDFLSKKGFYVFLHAHSYPITLHLELSSRFQSLHQSGQFKDLKPLESRRKFRAPGVAGHYSNTTEYLKSSLGKLINWGLTIDDRHRESIISCDAIPDNNEAYESAQHFFKSNRSIVDTHSSTGLKSKVFDAQFLKSFIHNEDLCNYAVELFASARKKLSFANYGMIRIIAIAKKTLENEKTNFIWRSHAFGVLCTCKQSTGLFGHNEFVKTLQENQKGKYKRCSHGSIPQYRILAENLDRSITKQVYTMDCLSDEERNRYNVIFNDLCRHLSNIIRLERIGECKSVEQMALILNSVNLSTTSTDYHKGITKVLKDHSSLIKDYLTALKPILKNEVYAFVSASLK